MQKNGTIMRITPGTDTNAATRTARSAGFYDLAAQKEQAEREAVKDHTQAGLDKINAAISPDFETKRQAVQSRAEKLQALKQKLDELPAELAKLDAEEERMQCALGTAIEDGKDLAKLTKELTSIRAKKQEIEVMHEVLGKKTIPNAMQLLEAAREDFASQAAEVIGAVLQAQCDEIDSAIQALNLNLLGWAYALDDLVDNLGLRKIRSSLEHLNFRVERFEGIPGSFGPLQAKAASQEWKPEEESLTNLV